MLYYAFCVSNIMLVVYYCKICIYIKCNPLKSDDDDDIDALTCFYIS